MRTSAIKEQNVERVESVEKYIEKIEKLRKEVGKSQKFLLRGQANKDWELIPSIFRMKNYNVEKEKEIYHIIDKMNFSQFSKKLFLNKVIEAQHFGIPTRLLDWTDNPLIALYFAANEEKESDGKIFVYWTSDIIQFDNEYFEILSKIIEDILKNVNVRRSDEKIDDFISKFFKFFLGEDILFLEVKFENDRLKAQSGYFSIIFSELIFSNYFDRIMKECFKKTISWNKWKIEFNDKPFINDLNILANKFIKKESIVPESISEKIDHILLKYIKKRSVLRGNEKKLKEIRFRLQNYLIDLKREVKNRNLTRKHTWPPTNKNYFTFEISAGAKNHIREQLEFLKISALTVFPDIYGLSEYFKRTFWEV